jgi:uncharacterized damage-inducible protein DinB
MHLRNLLVDTHAHMPPAQILEDLAEQHAAQRISNMPHSIAEVLAHVEFWQNWFLKRCRGEEAPFPESAALGWPAVSAENWNGIRERFLKGLEAAAAFDAHPDLLEKPIHPAFEFPPMADYTIRDALLHLANHNSHHLGQIVTLRQLLGVWPPAKGSWTW